MSTQPVPLDLKPSWLNCFRRLQSATTHIRHTRGLAIIGIKILVNSDGDPIQWTEPHVTLLEPWQKPKDFLALLTD